MPSPFKTCWANPWLRRPVLVALALGLVVGLACVAIDRLGKDAWRAASDRMAREGETTDFRALLSQPLPDEDNFCAIGPLNSIAAAEDDRSPAGQEGRDHRARLKEVFAGTGVRKAGGMKGAHKGIPLDFRQIAQAMRLEAGWPIPPEEGDPVQDVSAALERWEPFFAEISPALRRSGAQWTPCFSQKPLKRPYSSMGVPHLIPVLELGRGLAFRAAVAGTAGDFPKALMSLRMAARLADASSEEPLLINGLVGSAVESLLVHAVWQLCWSQQGSAKEWLELERLLAGINLRTAALRTHRGELAAMLDTIFAARDVRDEKTLRILLPGMQMPGEPLSGAEAAAVMALRLAPAGFFDGIAADAVDLELRHILAPLRSGDWLALQRGRASLTAEATRATSFPWNFSRLVWRQSLAQFGMTLDQVVYWQAVLHQAVIACALEQKRLSTGAYPILLEGLTLADGKPLPLDTATGLPMHYRPTPDGRYTLWSVGFDGKDDHATRGAGSQMSTEYVGDWVWSFTP